ncbi:MAG TPA: phosphatase [Bacteroidetes bacterium]|nr:phosphatase [Bacteroidota bacterium]
MNWQGFEIDKSWTLFLDRDGVINKNIEGGYVLSKNMYQWLNGSREAISKLTKIFGRIIIVTNQQGIGKGLMSEQDLIDIHTYMTTEIEMQGGRIDAIYHSPHLNSQNHEWRKPGTGMLLKAQEDFPEINFNKSIMIGDSVRDMEMAHRVRMKKVWIGEQPPTQFEVDASHSSLINFSNSIS